MKHNWFSFKKIEGLELRICIVADDEEVMAAVVVDVDDNVIAAADVAVAVVVVVVVDQHQVQQNPLARKKGIPDFFFNLFVSFLTSRV